MKKSLFVSTSCAVIASLAAPAIAQDGGAPPAQASENQPREVGDESTAQATITVTGIRESLAGALGVRRNSTNLVDSIFAEDIGRLPDVNVAEALQRVPGVTVGRDAGEGRTISVRGLGANFNVTTFNGRRLASEDPNRQFNYDILATELVSRIDVNKTSQAKLPEGGVGAVIDVMTYRPFQLEDGALILSGFGVYDEYADKTNPRLGALYSRRFADDTFGVLVSLNYSKRNLVQDEAKTTEYDRAYPFDPADSGTSSLNANTNYTLPRALSFVRSNEERERYGGTVAVQWRPTDQLELNIDGLYAVYNDRNEAAIFSNILDQANRFYFGHPTTQSATADSAGNLVSMGWGAGPGAANPFAFVQNESWTFPRVTDTWQVGGNLTYRPNADLTLVLDLSHSEARRSDDGDSWVLKTQTAVRNASYDWTDGELPDLTFSETPGSLFPRQIAGLENTGNDVRNRITDITLKGEWNAGGFFDAVRFGAGYLSEEKRNLVYRTASFDTFFGGQINGDFYDSGNYGGGAFAFNVGDIGPHHSFSVPDTIFTEQVTGFLPAFSGANIPRAWASANIGSYLTWLEALSDYTNANPRFESTPRPVPGAWELLQARFSPAESYSVQENVAYGYLEADKEGELSGIPYRLNLGVRIAHTNQSSDGFVTTPQAFYANDAFQFAIRGVDWGAPAAVSFQRSYTDVLPSMNFTLMPSDDIQIRLAAAKVMARAPISALRPGFENPNFASGVVVMGNPDLEPLRATQFDAAFEWYFTPSSALLLGVFYKDLDTFIATGDRDETVTYTAPVQCHSANFCFFGFNGVVNGVTPLTATLGLRGPFNGEGGNVRGIEFSWQQSIGDFVPALEGLGFVFNGTYSASSTNLSDRLGNALGIEGLSEWSYNAIGYYETKQFGVRVAYNWRDEYLLTSGNDPIYHSPIGWLDASAYLKLSEVVELNAYASNILDTQVRGTYGNQSGAFNDFVNFIGFTGRQIGFGIRAKF